MERVSALDGFFDVCRVGTWTDVAGQTVRLEESDLDNLVAQFGKSDPVPVVVGHPKVDAPAYGYVDQVRRVGDRLQAKLRDIAPAFRNAVEAGNYTGRSIAFTRQGGLRHLGFLGGYAPAVPGLAPTQFSSGDGFTTVELALGADGTLAGPREAALAAREAAFAAREFKADIDGRIERHVKAGRVLPAEKERLAAICVRLAASGECIQFAAPGEDGQVEQSPLDALEGFLEQLPVRVHYGELAGGPMPPRTGDGAAGRHAAMQRDVKRAQELMAEAHREGRQLRPQEAIMLAEKENA